MVERNRLSNNVRGIGFGNLSAPSGNGTECEATQDSDVQGGMIRNNFVSGADPGLLQSRNGFDVGIALNATCRAAVVHNTVASTETPTSSSIEWRFYTSSTKLFNNLTTDVLKDRGGVVSLVGNIDNAQSSDFIDLSGGNLHLSRGSRALDSGDPMGMSLAPKDIDGETRPDSPDVGADESL